jgi:hypothetical protein
VRRKPSHTGTATRFACRRSLVQTVAVVLVCLIVSTAMAATSPTDAAPAVPTDARLLLGNTYPIDVSVTFHEALLHWLDSLVMLTGPGGTAGKTVAAHRKEYEGLFGRPSPQDSAMLKRYHAARQGFVRGADRDDRHRLTLAFFEASNLNDALERAGELLDAGAAKDFDTAVRHFEPRYRQVWKEGSIPEGFLARVRASERREELAAFLVNAARLLGISPQQDPHPRLVLVPVPSGYGTHAQAIGPFLLVEVQRGEGLADEVAPIVHENVHFLLSRIPARRIEALERAARNVKPWGADAWGLLQEALPTAIAQGVADRSFRPEDWSRRQPWYHTEAVDRYAKRIFPLVEEALRQNGSLDESLVKRLVGAYAPP